MAGERLKAFYDVITNPQRYRNSDGEDRVDLDKETDPSTWRDETSATWKEGLASRKRLVFLFGYIGLVGIGVLAIYTNRFAPGLTGNPILQELLKWLVAVPLLVWIGTRLIRSKLRQVDWLVLLIPRSETKGGGLGFYVGNQTEDSAGNALFEPIKGFSLAGLSGTRLTLGDLADDWQRQWSKQGRDASDPARIRIEDALYADRDTFIGSVTGVLTDGLVYDEFGTESDLVTKEPKIVDPERYRDLATSLSDLQRRKTQLETELDNVKDDRDTWRDRAQQREEEIRKRIVKTHSELAEAGMKPRGTAAQPTQSPGERAMANGGQN